MPTTINSPNFWNLTVDNLMNNTDRQANKDGSYSFVKPEQDKVVTDPDTKHLMPWPDLADKASPTEFYNTLMGVMKSEVEDNDIPYNSQRTLERVDPDILDAVKRWILNGGAREK